MNNKQFSNRGVIVSRKLKMSPDSQRSPQTISVVLYSERSINSNRCTSKHSKVNSPKELLSNKDLQINTINTNKMGYQVDPNPLKNKVLAKNSNETNEFIQEKVTDYKQAEGSTVQTTGNIKKNQNYAQKINSDSDEISSLEEFSQDINSIQKCSCRHYLGTSVQICNYCKAFKAPRRPTEEDYDIIAEQEEYRAHILNSKTPMSPSRFRIANRMLPPSRQRPISASVNTYVVSHRFVSRPLSGARAIQHRPSKKSRSKVSNNLQLEAKSIKWGSRDDDLHHHSGQMQISKTMERVISQQQLNENYLSGKCGDQYINSRNLYKYAKKNQLKTGGGFVNASPNSRFTLRKKINPSTTRSESNLLTKHNSTDLQDVILNGESISNMPLKSMNLVFQSNQSPSNAKSMLENNPVIKMNNSSYRKDTSGYLARIKKSKKSKKAEEVLN